MFDYIKKLTGGGKTLALGGAAVLVKVLTPIAQQHGYEIPQGFEDAVATILLFLMGFVGLGSKNVKATESTDIAHANIAILGNQVAVLQAAEEDRKRLALEAKRKADEEAKMRAEMEAKAAIDAKKKAEEEEKEKLRKEVEELRKQLQAAK